MATATGVATLGQLTTEDKTFYELTMLDRAIPNFPHIYFALMGQIRDVATLPENEGTTIAWNKLSALTAVTTALTEGITPESQNITTTSTTAQVREYGAYIKYTRTLAEMGIHRIAEEAADALGEQAGDSLDLLTRAGLVAETTNIQYVNNRANANAVVQTDYLSFAEIMEGVTTLRTNKAVPPLVGNKFPTIVHPKVHFDLMSDSVIQAIFIQGQARDSSNQMITGYLGDVASQSFFESPNAYYAANSGSVNVYTTLILGKGSFGVGGLAAYMPQIMREQQEKSNHTFEKVRPLRLIEKPFGSTGVADPFDRLASIAWYTTFVVKVLDANFFVQIQSASRLS